MMAAVQMYLDAMMAAGAVQVESVTAKGVEYVIDQAAQRSEGEGVSGCWL